jgi:hypothetical protein
LAHPPFPDDDALAAWLVRRFPKTVAGTPEAVCPDADLLAAFAEGSLPEEGQAAVESHLAACASCTSAADELASLGATAPRVARRPTLRLLAIAAVLLVAAGVAFVVAREGDAPPADADALLVASARRMASARPDLFADLRPLLHAERTAAVPTQVRGGLVPGSPAGVVLDPRPTFRWTPVPGVDAYVVSVIAADGATVWSRRVAGPPADYSLGAGPSLVDGATYAWEVSAEGPAGPVSGRRGFRVASREEVALVLAAREALEERSEERLFPHWLARREMWAEAEVVLFARVAPDAADVELLRYVRARMGVVDEAGRGKG